MSCAPPAGGVGLAGVDVADQAVIEGRVASAGDPVERAYVRLLDGDGEFTAEVVTDAAGGFRFFARPGTWTLRVLSARGNAETTATAALGETVRAHITLG